MNHLAAGLLQSLKFAHLKLFSCLNHGEKNENNLKNPLCKNTGH